MNDSIGRGVRVQPAGVADRRRRGRRFSEVGVSGPPEFGPFSSGPGTRVTKETGLDASAGSMTRTRSGSVGAVRSGESKERTRMDDMTDTSDGAQTDSPLENWFLLMDPAWSPAKENEAPPIEAVVGLWPRLKEFL